MDNTINMMQDMIMNSWLVDFIRFKKKKKFLNKNNANFSYAELCFSKKFMLSTTNLIFLREYERMSFSRYQNGCVESKELSKMSFFIKNY